MSCSINKLKSHLFFTCKNFMFYDFKWKKGFVPWNGEAGGGLLRGDWWEKHFWELECWRNKFILWNSSRSHYKFYDFIGAKGFKKIFHEESVWEDTWQISREMLGENLKSIRNSQNYSLVPSLRVKWKFC